MEKEMVRSFNLITTQQIGDPIHFIFIISPFLEPHPETIAIRIYLFSEET
jgi:hypothetical protein